MRWQSQKHGFAGLQRQAGLKAAGQRVASGGGPADKRIAVKNITNVTAAAAAFGINPCIEGLHQGAQRRFAGGGESFAQNFRAIAVGQAGPAVADGKGVRQMPQQDQEKWLDGGHAGRPRGLGQAGGDFGNRQQSAGQDETVAQGLFDTVEKRVGEFAEKSAVDHDASGQEPGQEQKGADGGSAAPGGVRAAGERSGIQRAAGGMQGFFRGVEKGFGGEKRQGLVQGAEGQGQQLAGALAGDAQLETGIAQLGFVKGEGGGGIVQTEVELQGIGQAGREKQGEPFREVQAGRSPFAGGAAPGGDAAEQGAVVGIERFAGRRRIAQIPESVRTVGAKGGHNARRQAAGREGGIAKSIESGRCRGRAHRFGAVAAASSFSYSAAVSSFFSSTSSLSVWPVARPSLTRAATRS